MRRPSVTYIGITFNCIAWILLFALHSDDVEIGNKTVKSSNLHTQEVRKHSNIIPMSNKKLAIFG